MNDSITDVMEEKGRARVVVNGEETLHFSRSAFAERPLTAGENVDLEELKEWLLPRQYPEALARAVSFLAVRARSTLEVQQKLETKGYLEPTIELVLYKLTKEKLLDDEAFARGWAQARAHRQLGSRRILQELRQKGISRETAERAVQELQEGEEPEAPLHRLAQKLLRRVENEPDPQKAMRKVMAALARRGFSFEEARGAVEAALGEMEGDTAP